MVWSYRIYNCYFIYIDNDVPSKIQVNSYFHSDTYSYRDRCGLEYRD